MCEECNDTREAFTNDQLRSQVRGLTRERDTALSELADAVAQLKACRAELADAQRGERDALLEARRLKERERDICQAVGGVSDGGQFRNDIIEHLQMLYAQASKRTA